MLRRRWIRTTLSGAFIAAAVVGCAIDPKSPATVTRDPAPNTSAPIATSDGVIGTLIGGELGEYGGSLIGVQLDKSDPKYRDEALAAALHADLHPATSSDAKDSDTADLNHDGYVTMDEVIAMRDAGVPEQDLIRRLRQTNQIFELTEHQRNVLRDDAVGERVIEAMLGMSRSSPTAAIERVKQAVGPDPNATPINNSTER